MKPIGLTMKKSRNKYRLESGGELMLIHECVECGTLSINRIAADDDPDSVMDAFDSSLSLNRQIRTRCEAQGIVIVSDVEAVHIQLYGQNVGLPIPA